MPENTFFQDLLNAQKSIEAVEKDAKNPFFKSDYTSLTATILACKQALNDHNIIVLQPIESDENGVYIATTLIHTSGERLTSKMRITVAKVNDPQAQGSAITYARRYSLKAMFTMFDEDDDGEKAMARTKTESVPDTANLDREDNLTATCKVHNVPMIQRWSEKKQKNYWYHKNEEGEICFGKNYLERNQ